MLVILVAAFTIRPADWSVYAYLVQEDGPIEWAQALLYLAAALCAWRLAYHDLSTGGPSGPGWTFLLVGAALACVAAEEVSWGQRVFGIRTPGFMWRHNVQNELTLHNLEPVQRVLHQAYMVAGLYGMLSHRAAGWFLDRLTLVRRFRLDLLIVPRRLSLLFLPVFAFYFGYEFLHEEARVPWLHSRDQELAELFLALGSLAFMYERVRSEVYRRPRLDSGELAVSPTRKGVGAAAFEGTSGPGG